jgi:hypothetical protein
MTDRETLEQLIDRAEVMLMSRSHPPNAENLAADLDERTQLGYDLLAALRAAPAPPDVIEDLVVALRSLAYAAMTSGGTKGPDVALKDAIRWATDALQKYDKLRAAPAPEPEHVCGGCGYKWNWPVPSPIELCGDCWRKTWPVLRDAAPAPEGETPMPRCVVCRTEYPTTGQQAGPVAGVWGKNFMVCRLCVGAARDAKRKRNAPASPGPTPEAPPSVKGFRCRDCEHFFINDSMQDGDPCPYGRCDGHVYSEQIK